LCAPGCFSVYRVKALRDVIPTYASHVEKGLVSIEVIMVVAFSMEVIMVVAFSIEVIMVVAFSMEVIMVVAFSIEVIMVAFTFTCNGCRLLFHNRKSHNNYHQNRESHNH
jgi:hypothetical protein